MFSLPYCKCSKTALKKIGSHQKGQHSKHITVSHSTFAHCRNQKFTSLWVKEELSICKMHGGTSILSPVDDTGFLYPTLKPWDRDTYSKPRVALCSSSTSCYRWWRCGKMSSHGAGKQRDRGRLSSTRNCAEPLPRCCSSVSQTWDWLAACLGSITVCYRTLNPLVLYFSQ